MVIGKRIVLKLFYYTKMLLYKLSYKNSFQTGVGFSFRKRFDLNINDKGIVKIGDHVFFNDDCSINCRNVIDIGNNCIFGENVKIYDHNHKFSSYSRLIYEQGYKLKRVVIKDNCWIGSNVVILPGTEIGANSIIGAGCVISGVIPEGMIVTSNRKLEFVRRNRDG